jgi:hypothetical protein
MRNLLMAAMVVSAMIGGATLASADPAASTDPNATNASPQLDKNEMICKRGEITTGSRFPGPPICHTRMEWEQIRRDDQEAMTNRQNKMDFANQPHGQ